MAKRATGGVKFTDNSGKIMDQLREAAEAALEAAALVVEGQAKALAQVDTGQLRDSIGHRIQAHGDELIGTVGSSQKHAIYAEFGTGEYAENGAGRQGGWSYTTPDGKWHFTRGMRPVKFLRTAFRATSSDVQDILKRRLGAEFRGRK